MKKFIVLKSVVSNLSLKHENGVDQENEFDWIFSEALNAQPYRRWRQPVLRPRNDEGGWKLVTSYTGRGWLLHNLQIGR